MSWAKRNLYFLISGILAVGLLIAAGWYCYSESQTNNAKWEELNSDYSTLATIANEPVGAGNETVDNIQAARDETKQVRERIASARKYFTPVPTIPSSGRLDDRSLAFAVRETIAQLRTSAAQHNVTLPLDFAFSFSLQQGKAVYDPKSWAQLSKQLGEVKFICDTLYAARVSSLDGVQRERTDDDLSLAQVGGGQPDYVDSIAVTNANLVITPYQVTFRCFTPELGGVLSSFANQSHTIIVKTLSIQPEDMVNNAEGGMMPGLERTTVAPRSGLPVVIDEKKLKVTILLDFVKMLPGAG